MKSSLFISLLACLALSGCVSIPQDIQGSNSLLSGVSYQDIRQDISRFNGQEVRLGGKVLNVVNSQNETSFEVAVLPLDSSARPELGTAFQGRIIVKANRFIEPLTLKDHLVTVLGTVTGTTNGKVGEADYQYLTLSLQGYQVWQIRENIVPVNYSGFGGYGPNPYWRYGWGAMNTVYMPGWGWYPAGTMFQVEQQVVK